ncbi:MAG: signal peptidase I [Chloroflexota bacterium]
MAANQSRIRGILSITGIIILFLVMLTGVTLYMTPKFGWRIDGLRSGSMAPELNVGDLVITRPVTPADIAVGDVIIFHYTGSAAESFVIHRVIGIQDNPSLAFETKGDANAAVDPFITPAQNLVGRLFFHAPSLGYAVLFCQTRPGLLLTIVLPGFISIWLCLQNLGFELAKKTRKNHGLGNAPCDTEDLKQPYSR